MADQRRFRVCRPVVSRLWRLDRQADRSGNAVGRGGCLRFCGGTLSGATIIVWGESLGTGVAVALAAERQIGGLILDAPFSSAADIGASAYPFVPVRWFIKDSFRSDERIGRVTVPLLILHGEMDPIVPIRFGERLFALANEPKQMVRFPSGGHVNLDDHGAPDAVRAFLNGLPRTLN